MKREKIQNYFPQYTQGETAAMKSAVDDFKQLPPDERAKILHELKCKCGLNMADEISRHNARCCRDLKTQSVKPMCGEPIEHKRGEWGNLIVAVQKQFGIAPSEIHAL
jgi:hypothetical protein